jgi:hypothetical protein
MTLLLLLFPFHHHDLLYLHLVHVHDLFHLEVHAHWYLISSHSSYPEEAHYCMTVELLHDPHESFHEEKRMPYSRILLSIHLSKDHSAADR